MSNIQSLAVSIGTSSGTVLIPEDGFWIILKQLGLEEDKPELVTAPEAAKFIDALYDVDPCVKTNIPPEEVTQEKFIEEVKKSFITEDDCEMYRTGNYKVQVEVSRSHLTVPYRLRVSIGTIVSTRQISEVKDDAFNIDNQSSFTLPYPIFPFDQIKASWSGDVSNKSGAIFPPVIRVIGNTLYWLEDVVGIIRVQWSTLYDIVEILVPGIAPTETEKFGVTQDTNVIAFYNGKAESLTIRAPDEDPSTMDYSLLSSICTGLPPVVPGLSTGNVDNIDPEDPYEPVKVPPNEECLGTAEWANSPSMWEEKCCDPIDVKNLQNCIKYRRKKPSKKMREEDRKYLDSLVGKTYNDGGFLIEIEAVQDVPIGPHPDSEDGCGWDIYDLKATGLQCCTGVPPLIWDDEITPDILPRNSSITISWYGGSGRKVTITTSNSVTYFFGGKRTVTGYGNNIELYSGGTFCGYTVVSVSDGCSTNTISIRSDYGRWVETLPSVCTLTGKSVDWTNPYQNVLYGNLISGNDKIFEIVDSYYGYISISRIAECELPFCPPYTQCCAQCYGTAYCPTALAYVDSQPKSCLSYARRQGTVWLRWSEEDGVFTGAPLMKHCSDQATLLYSGGLIPNYCYNTNVRVCYIKPGALYSYKWVC